MAGKRNRKKKEKKGRKKNKVQQKQAYGRKLNTTEAKVNGETTEGESNVEPSSVQDLINLENDIGEDISNKFNDITKIGVEHNCTDENAIEKMETGSSQKSKGNNADEGTKVNASIFDFPSNLAHETKATIRNSPLKATIFVAAPTLKNHKLAITGEDVNLGRWKQPEGNFEPFIKFKKDFILFKGTVPVPILTGSTFKFVHWNAAECNIEYEGDDDSDNRTEELLPDSWNFFVFKPKAISKWVKVGQWIASYVFKPETSECIALEFFKIVFNHTLDSLIPDWDDAFEFLDESFQKIRRAVGDFTSIGFREFLNQWLETPEHRDNLDKLMLLIVGACKMGVVTDKIKNVLQSKRKEFSIYLHNFRSMKRKMQDLDVVQERIVTHGGRDFWWIAFHIGRTEILQKFKHQEVSTSIIKTFQDIPEVLLACPNCAARVVEYMVKWNDIEDLYRSMLPVFAQNGNCQPRLGPLLLKSFLNQKSNIDDVIKILRSDLMKNVYYQNIPPPLESDNELPNQQNRGSHFIESIHTIFNRKLSDIIRLACCTPDYMLPIVTPIVDTAVMGKLKNKTNFSQDDYRFFTTLENFNNFPEAKRQIETLLLKMTNEQLKSGSFQSVPSVKLMLIGLSEIKDIPFLEQGNLVDLQKAMGQLPLKYFQNLNSALNENGSSVENKLKPYRKGATKDIVEKLENHFDFLEDIVVQVQKRQVPLNQLSSLDVSK